MLVVYQPCEKIKTSKGFTVFEQHEKYFEPKGDYQSPQMVFFKQLVAKLLIWKANHEEIILFGDFNDHAYSGRLTKHLLGDNILISEQCKSCTGECLLPKFLWGQHPIDVVSATLDIKFLNVGLLPLQGGVDDHCCFILDFESASHFAETFSHMLPENS